MVDVPIFRLYGEGNPEIENRMQARLALRRWSDLSRQDREIFVRELFNRDWISPHSKSVLTAVSYLNRTLLRELPGKRLHKLKPISDQYGGNERERTAAAYADFCEILVETENEEIVLRMLSAFASTIIEKWAIDSAKKEGDEAKRKKLIDKAYEKFDGLMATLNYLFRQFAVNVQVTRAGFAPVQDQVIAEQIYAPVLAALSDPKYERVSNDLAKMFADYRAGNTAEVITKAHSAVQRFLQINVGTEGENKRGELSELFRAAKANGLVSTTRFGEPLIKVLEGFFPSERATNSTAKPSIKDATHRDAMLMMDLVLVFIQHCLAA